MVEDQQALEAGPAQVEAAPPTPPVSEPAPIEKETAPIEREPAPFRKEPAAPVIREREPAPVPAIQQAIEQVNHIISTLKEALDDMDEVLETLELAERQKNADENDIENLRRALRQLQRPREGGPHHRGHP